MRYLNKRMLIVLGGFASLFILVLLIIILTVQTKKSDTSTGATYYDPLSHETVSNPPGKAPDVFGSNPDRPVYLGFDDLLNNGLTLDQLSFLKTGFYNYSKASGGIKEISVDIASITNSHDKATPGSAFVIEFNVRTDRKNDFLAQIQYRDLSSLKLILLDPKTRAQVFDSGLIGP